MNASIIIWGLDATGEGIRVDIGVGPVDAEAVGPEGEDGAPALDRHLLREPLGGGH